MRRLTATLIALMLPVTLFAGCGNGKASETPAKAGTNGADGGGLSGRLSIVSTIFPSYDWVRRILGDRADEADLTLLLDSKIDLHSYQPSVDDIVRISECDLFIYVGGESDEWVEEALGNAKNSDMTAINLLEVLGGAAKTEEIVEGMEDDEDEDEGHGGDEAEYDEHVWLSLKNAEFFCKVIAETLASIDPDNADAYAANMTAYIAELSALDAQFSAAAAEADVKILLFADRFPFRYFADDYGIVYYAAFAGCSAETEAGFETIVFLAGKVDELGLKNIMVTESTDQSIAKTVINSTSGKNQRILIMDSMQSVSSADVKNGATYISIMESNLAAFREAVNGE